MIKKLKFLPALISLILFSSVFVGSLFPPSDPDLGWHLKYGEYFFEHKSILNDNTFSALMPDYKWNNSSWGTDLITFKSYDLLGFLGISIAGALVVTLSFYFITKSAKYDLFEKAILFPILLFLTLPVNQVSFRGQILSLLLMSMMYFFLTKYRENNKKILLLIPFFTLWANLHGEFVMGLGLFLLWIIIYLAKEWYLNYRENFTKLFSNNKFLIITFFGSIISSIISPFGIGVYLESLGHFSDPLQASIVEFLPPQSFSHVWWHQLIVGVVISMGIVMIGLSRKNFDLAPFSLPSLLLFIFSLWIRRYIWPFYYSAVFLIKPVISFLKPPGKRHQEIVALVFSLFFLITTIYLKKDTIIKIKNMTWNDYCKISVSCSTNSAEFVIKNNLNYEKLLTIYDYGGWIIWNYPEIKPTIDGRMHLWRDEKNYSAFEYYYPIEQNLKGADIDKTPYNSVLTSRQKPIYFRLNNLVREGLWKKAYEDNYSAVFVRN